MARQRFREYPACQKAVQAGRPLCHIRDIYFQTGTGYAPGKGSGDRCRHPDRKIPTVKIKYVLSKNKHKKFEELNSFERVFQPGFDEFFDTDYRLKGKWKREVFGNDHPLVLELGCGKGEYTIGLAKKFTDMNFIGVDIKGARMWKGAKISNVEDIRNSAFLRTRIEFISAFFGRDEVGEIWITFPDPQLKKRRNKKRLTGSLFLKKYQEFPRRRRDHSPENRQQAIV